MDRIKVISVNVNGMRARELDLANYIHKQGKNCIFAISDTRLTEGVNIGNINGYTMLREDKYIGIIMLKWPRQGAWPF